MREMHSSVSKKVAEDVAVWAFVWGRKRSFGLLAQLIFLEAGFQFTLGLRLTEFLRKLPLVGKPLAVINNYLVNRLFSCDVARRCTLGGGLFMPHPIGIVIGADVVVGHRVSLMHQTTLGRLYPEDHSYPTLGDDVYISPGAKVLGAIFVGDGAMVGANSVLMCDVPIDGLAVGMPARVLGKKRLRNLTRPKP